MKGISKHQFTLFVLTLLTQVSCSSRRGNTEEADFKIISSTLKYSFGGVAGSGSARIFELELKPTHKMKFVADSVFMDSMAEMPNITLNGKPIKYGDTIELKKKSILKYMIVFRTESTIGGGDAQMVLPGSPYGVLSGLKPGEMGCRYGGGRNSSLIVRKWQQLEPELGE